MEYILDALQTSVCVAGPYYTTQAAPQRAACLLSVEAKRHPLTCVMSRSEQLRGAPPTAGARSGDIRLRD